MKYMILQYVGKEDTVDSASFQSGEDRAAWMAYSKALAESGVMVSGNALHGAGTATTLRIREGQRDIHDGPYADTKEQLGGYYIVDVPDLDTALLWAAKSPAASKGAVEVRPLFSP